ncbi:MAG: GTP 3',8-cyclase MoaA [Eubacterium sp.]|nr:GTP 3',8-cyclase MoaA [Eubacterium sp.]
MRDGFGRKIEYLRISVTDRCNLRCRYCMPEDGVELLPHEMILNFDEIERVCRIMAHMGINKIKLTGGEPLVRRGLSDLVRNLKSIDGIDSVTLTTNGLLLSTYMESLVDSGIDSVNISLDTLDPFVFRRIAGVDGIEDVKRGIHEALKYPGIDVKINCVPMEMSGQNPWEVAGLAADYPIFVRFIEMMPVGLGKNYRCIGEDAIREKLEEIYGEMIPVRRRIGNGPCRYFDIEGLKGKIGFISAMSHGFCDSCNRIRLTSVGFLKTCLQYDKGVDLRALLRGGATDGEIRGAIEEAVLQKPASHMFQSECAADGDSPGDGTVDKSSPYSNYENGQMWRIGG